MLGASSIKDCVTEDKDDLKERKTKCRKSWVWVEKSIYDSLHIGSHYPDPR